jgi:hypothetical protein
MSTGIVPIQMGVVSTTTHETSWQLVETELLLLSDYGTSGVILNPDEWKAQAAICLKVVAQQFYNDSDRLFFESFRVGNGKHLTVEERNALTYGATMLRFTQASIERQVYRQDGISDYVRGKMEWLDFIAKSVIEDRKFFQVGSRRMLAQKLQEWQTGGNQAIVPAFFGRQNNLKIKGSVADFIIREYALNKKPYAILPDLVEAQFGLKLNVQSIRDYLHKSEVMQIWLPQREGILAAKKRLETRLTMASISFADASWQIDSTPLALMAQVEGKLRKTPIVRCVVMDVYSRAFIGVAYGRTENTDLVMAALRDALRIGRTPHLMRYDKGSANMGDAIQAALDKIAEVHFPTAAHEPNGKPHIEKAQDILESGYLRYYDNFAGGNVDRVGTEKTANPDTIKAMMKRGELPSPMETMEQDMEAIRRYNTDVKKGETLSKLQKYHACRKHFVEATEEVQSVTWTKKSIEYGQNGIKFQHANLPQVFWVGEPMREDETFKEFNFGKTFEVRFDPDNELIPHVRLYENGRFVTQAVAQHRFSHVPSLRAEGEGTQLTEMRSQNKRLISDSMEGFGAVELRLEDEGIPRFEFFGKKGASEAAEAREIERQIVGNETVKAPKSKEAKVKVTKVKESVERVELPKDDYENINICDIWD